MNKEIITTKHQVQISGQWFDIIRHHQSEHVLYIDKEPKPVNLELVKDLIEDIRYKHVFKLDDCYRPDPAIPFKYELYDIVDVQSGLTPEDRFLYGFWEEYFFKTEDLKRITMETVAWQAFNFGRRLEEVKQTKVGK